MDLNRYLETSRKLSKLSNQINELESINKNKKITLDLIFKNILANIISYLLCLFFLCLFVGFNNVNMGKIILMYTCSYILIQVITYCIEKILKSKKIKETKDLYKVEDLNDVIELKKKEIKEVKNYYFKITEELNNPITLLELYKNKDKYPKSIQSLILQKIEEKRKKDISEKLDEKIERFLEEEINKNNKKTEIKIY